MTLSYGYMVWAVDVDGDMDVDVDVDIWWPTHPDRWAKAKVPSRRHIGGLIEMAKLISDALSTDCISPRPKTYIQCCPKAR